MTVHPDLAEALAAFERGDLERARRLAEQRAAENPTAQIEHLLGLIHCRAGDPASGVEHLRRAVGREPENPVHQVMLARALVDSGRAGEVLAMSEPARDNAPASLALWHARAEASDAERNWINSANSWEIIAHARPTDWRAWHNLGNALAACEQWERAVDAFRRAVLLEPQRAELRRKFAAALGRCGLLDESIAQLEEALKLEPHHLESRLSLARLLADVDRPQESLVQLEMASRLATGGVGKQGGPMVALGRFRGFDEADRPAFSFGPDDVNAIRELGLLLERTNQMDALRELLEQTSAAEVAQDRLGYLFAASELREGRAEVAENWLMQESPDSDPVRWHRLRAKIAEARGDAAAAFAAAEQMNRSVRGFDDWVRRGTEYRQRIRSLAALVTPEWAGSLPRLPPPDRRAPAFLVGFPRSGTTLLDTFLMGHPETEVLEEVHLLGQAELVVGNVRELQGCSIDTLLKAREAYFAELDRHVDPSFAGLVIDKLPLNMLGAPLIHLLFPEALIIFAQRHPCDAVLSGFMQSFVMNDAMACFLEIESAADLYDTVMQVWTNSRESLPLSVHSLIYEELVVDPARALKPLIAFLGLDWNDELLDHRSTAKHRGAIITPSYDQVTEPLTQRASGRWRRYIDQLEPVLPVLLPWTRRLGYGD